MTTKSTLHTLIAVATLAAAGVAFAQSQPPTSTPGAGCTATANAMRGGNLGGTATNKDCVSAGAKTAVVPAAPVAAAPAAAPAVVEATPSTSTAMGAPEAAPAKPMRIARADRN